MLLRVIAHQEVQIVHDCILCNCSYLAITIYDILMSRIGLYVPAFYQLLVLHELRKELMSDLNHSHILTIFFKQWLIYLHINAV